MILQDACRAHGGGGAIMISSSAGNRLMASHVNILRCYAEGSGGGLYAYSGEASLVSSHIIECQGGISAGGCRIVAPAIFTMTGGSFERCTCIPASGLSSTIWSIGARAVLTGVSIIDGVSLAGGSSAISIQGDTRTGHFEMIGCQLRRLGAPDERGGQWFGAVQMNGGVLRLKETTIEGLTPDGPGSPQMAGCLNLLGGSTFLENVSLVRCSTAGVTSAYLRVGALADVVGAFVHIMPNCSEPPAKPMIEAHGTSSNRSLALRALRVSAGDGCSLPPARQLLADGTSLASCAQLPSIDGGSCGTAATCTDVALCAWTTVAFTSAECSCTGSTFARATAETSAELLPYSFGCFTPREAQTVSAVGVAASSVIFRLAKSAYADSVETRNLLISMGGTDHTTTSTWYISSASSWLYLEQFQGQINQTEAGAELQVSASTAMQPGQEDPHQGTLNVSVVSGIHRTFNIPVFLYVTATTVDAAWGTVTTGQSCANTTTPTAFVIVGTTTTIAFIGCDREGLKNSRRMPAVEDPRSFVANATSPNAPDTVMPIEFDEVTGDFHATFSPLQPGEYTLRLRLGGVLVASPLVVHAHGCPDGQIPNPENPNEPCQPCDGERWALEGDVTCDLCREDYYLSGSNCWRCPLGAVCDAASTVEDIRMLPGHASEEAQIRHTYTRVCAERPS